MTTWPLPFYCADFMGDTSDLNEAETGAYVLLLIYSWQRGGPIPMDDRSLALICRCPLKRWLRHKPKVLRYFSNTGFQKRLEKERLKITEIRHVRSLAGKRSVEVKSLKSNDGGSTHVPTKGATKPQQSLNKKSTQLPTNGQHTYTYKRESHQIESNPPRTAADAAGSDEIRFSNDDFAALEGKLREAAGLIDATSPRLRDLAPILALLREGVDLDREIIPKLRAMAHAGHTGGTWSYYAEAVRRDLAESRARPVASKPPSDPGLRMIDLGAGCVWSEAMIRKSMEIYRDQWVWTLPDRSEGDYRGVPPDLIPAELLDRKPRMRA